MLSTHRGRTAARIVSAALLAAIGVAAGDMAAAPAWAVDGVDLKASLGQVTFGAGSSMVFKNLQVSNTGTAKATKVVAKIELLSDATTAPLTFTGQRNACTPLSATTVTCPLPDVDASATITSDLFAVAIEAHPVPGTSNPTPMAVRARVTVSAAEPDLASADNTVTSGSILRTVVSAATDWVAYAKPIGERDRNGDLLYVSLDAANHGPAPTAQGEATFTYIAPPGTEWDQSFGSTCFEVRPKIEIRCTSEGSNPPDLNPPSYFRVRLKLVSTPVGDGEFRVEGMGGELNPSDNVAKIVIDIPGVPRVPSSGSSQPPAAGGGGGTGTPAAHASGTGGGLPVTGTNTGLIAGAGLIALVLGAVVYLLAQRRRVILVADDEHTA